MSPVLVMPPRPGTPGAKETLHFTVPFPPSLNNMFGNSGKGRRISAEYAAWREEAGYALNLQHLTTLHGPVVVTIMYPDSGRCDLDNLPKAILDLAVKRELIDGDGRKVVRAIYAVWAPVDQVHVAMARATA